MTQRPSAEEHGELAFAGRCTTKKGTERDFNKAQHEALGYFDRDNNPAHRSHCSASCRLWGPGLDLPPTTSLVGHHRLANDHGSATHGLSVGIYSTIVWRLALFDLQPAALSPLSIAGI